VQEGGASVRSVPQILTELRGTLEKFPADTSAVGIGYGMALVCIAQVIHVLERCESVLIAIEANTRKGKGDA
jgi:hypothetical protein